MEYAAYKLSFTGAVHFGQRTLTSREMTFSADRLFSALCIEALKEGSFEELLALANESKLLFSDAFPYASEEYFCPKPILPLKRKNNDEDIKTRKLFKKISYLPINKLEGYLAGKETAQDLKQPNFGQSSVKTSVKIDPTTDSEPYRVGLFSFNENCGLYIVVGYENKGKNLVENLLDSLSFMGIGGELSAGLGRFELLSGKIPAEMKKRLTGEYQTYMTISVSLPADEELPRAMDGANFLLQKKGGFVASSDYANEWRKKRDSFVFAAGSCFKTTFKGQIRDVSDGGNHSVYRYLKPMFLGVN